MNFIYKTMDIKMAKKLRKGGLIFKKSILGFDDKDLSN